MVDLRYVVITFDVENLRSEEAVFICKKTSLTVLVLLCWSIIASQSVFSCLTSCWTDADNHPNHQHLSYTIQLMKQLWLLQECIFLRVESMRKGRKGMKKTAFTWIRLFLNDSSQYTLFTNCKSEWFLLFLFASADNLPTSIAVTGAQESDNVDQINKGWFPHTWPTSKNCNSNPKVSVLDVILSKMFV